MKPLTRAEEQVMRSIWRLQSAYLKEIVDDQPDPKPHSNTIATILKILIDKGFVDIEVHGRVHRYFPLVTKDEYSSTTIESLVSNYFEGSFADVVSFMVKQKNIDVKDLELLLQQIKNKH
jgi:BlaI family penicillinase repressor